jgi:hypothetical protein
MPYPPLVKYLSEQKYRQHFEDVYCKQPLLTFDGISVRFRKSNFDHAFFESKNAKDDTFSMIRAERMDWIKAALEDPNSDRFVGWNNRLKCYDNTRRVTIVLKNYVIIIGITKKGAGFFITAFVADSDRTLSLIRKGPRWA